MARNEPDPRAQIPILDRLIDDDPKNRHEVPPTRLQSIRIYRASVRRDLEWLLNTRCTVFIPEDGAEHVKRSVYNFGLPDFSSYTASSGADRSRLLQFVKSTVEYFEPRLSSIVVAPNPDVEQDKRMVHFVISGLLHMEPAPEQVTFDSVLELSRNEYTVKG